jgi:hypothetical protein
MDVVESFIAPDVCDQAAADIILADQRYQLPGSEKTFCVQYTPHEPRWYDTFLPEEEALTAAAHEARVAITEKIIDGMKGLTWSVLDASVAVFQYPIGVPTHQDKLKDVRVLVDVTGGAKWILHSYKHPYSRYETRYPREMPVQKGDKITLNNQCPLEKRVPHGVNLLGGTNRRASFLYTFKDVAKQKRWWQFS